MFKHLLRIVFAASGLTMAVGAFGQEAGRIDGFGPNIADDRALDASLGVLSARIARLNSLESDGATVAAALATGGAGAMAGELPTWQVDGFVMTPHQHSVLTPANAQERLPTFAFVYGSPHQIMVLTPRRDFNTVSNGDARPQSSDDPLIKVSY